MYRKSKFNAYSAATAHKISSIRQLLAACSAVAALVAFAPTQASGEAETKFKPISTQFIAALSNPNANSGSDAQSWGLWRQDPGPRGVMIDRFERLKAADNVAPAQWKFDNNDWWLDEHGLIMEKPEFPIPAGKYLVTGDREVTTVLTIYPREKDGTQRWTLGNNAKLQDVTHLPCRSARYTADDNSCTPAKARKNLFPVSPGAVMPPVESCKKQDYAVLLVIGVAVDN